MGHREEGRAGSGSKWSRRRAKRRKEDILYGRRVLREALRKDPCRIKEIFLAGGIPRELLEEIRFLAARRRVSCHEVSRKRLDRLAEGGAHQGVVAVAEPREEKNLAELLLISGGTSSPPLFLVLEGITDPGNLGAIIRTAECFGCDGIVLSKKGAPPLDRSTAKRSAGAVEWVPLVRVGNLRTAMRRMKDSGVTLIAADLSPGSRDLGEGLAVEEPIAVVLGAEERGISEGTRALCDHRFSIPMEGRVGSLNVSVAAGIMLWEIFRRRIAAGIRAGG